MKCKNCGEDIIMDARCFVHRSTLYRWCEVTQAKPEEREIPLIDPAYLSKDMWGVGMDESGYWYRYVEIRPTCGKTRWKPVDGWLRLPDEAIPKGWDYAWTESDFSRDEIIQRWDHENNG